MHLLTGDEIKRIRKCLGKSVTELAMLIGMSKSIVSLVENGKRQASLRMLLELNKLPNIDWKFVKEGDNNQ